MMMSPQSSSEDFAGGTSDSVAKHFSMIAKTTWEGINLAVLMMFDAIIKSHANVDLSMFACDFMIASNWQCYSWRESCNICTYKALLHVTH
jgi:hypothetical protein